LRQLSPVFKLIERRSFSVKVNTAQLMTRQRSRIAGVEPEPNGQMRRRIMRIKQWIGATMIAITALAAQPAAAYDLKVTGRTRATPQLAADVIARIALYTKQNSRCAFLFSVDMKVMGPGYTPRQPAMPAAGRSGHYEQWMVNACGKKQLFQVGLWTSPRGGADYALTPMTGPMPLHVK
jgi:hypothetical protein